MDTTKELLVHETNGGAVYVTDNHRFTDAVTLIRIDNNRDTDPRATASELVRRWNSFPALVEALEGLLKATRKAHDIAAQSNDVYADDEALFVGEWMDEARAALKAASE